MLSELNRYNLSYFSFKHKQVPTNLAPQYDETYELWKNVWVDTFKELKDEKPITGDDFLALDEICTIFVENKPVSLIGLKEFHINRRSFLDTGYIQTFPQEVVTHLSEHEYIKIASIGQLAVHPDWRKQNSGLPLAETVIGLSLLACFQKNLDAAICYTRNNRGINQMIYRYGGQPLVENIIRHNVEVDMAIIPQNQFKPSDNTLAQELVELLWSNTRKQKSIEAA